MGLCPTTPSKGICGSCDQIIPSGHEQTGVHVDGSSKADIAWGLNTLLENMEKAREMGKRGRRRVEKYFSWDKRLSNNYPTSICLAHFKQSSLTSNFLSSS